MALVSDTWPFPAPGRSGALALESFTAGNAIAVAAANAAAANASSSGGGSTSIAAATATVDLGALPSPAVVARYARPGHTLRPSTAPLSRVRHTPVSTPTPPAGSEHQQQIWPPPIEGAQLSPTSTAMSASSAQLAAATALVRRRAAVPPSVAITPSSASASMVPARSNSYGALTLQPVIPPPLPSPTPPPSRILVASNSTAAPSSSWPVVPATSIPSPLPPSSSSSSSSSNVSPPVALLQAQQDEIYSLRREVARLRYDLSRHDHSSLAIATAVSDRDRSLQSSKHRIMVLEQEVRDALASQQRAEHDRSAMELIMERTRAAMIELQNENAKLVTANERLRHVTVVAQSKAQGHGTDSALLQRELSRLRAEHEPCGLLHAANARLTEQLKDSHDSIRGLQMRVATGDALAADERTKFNASQANVIRLTEQLAEQSLAYKRLQSELDAIARVDRELKATRSGYSIALEAMRKLQDAHAALQAAHDPCHRSLLEVRAAHAPLQAEVARLRAIVDGTSKEQVRRSQLIERARALLSMMTPHMGISFITSHDGHGVTVTTVQSRSSADVSGIRKRDRVLSVNAKSTNTKQQLIIAMEGFTPGTAVALQMSRGGASHMTMLTVGARGFALGEVQLIHRLCHRNDTDLDVDLEPLATRHLHHIAEPELERETEPIDMEPQLQPNSAHTSSHDMMRPLSSMSSQDTSSNGDATLVRV